MAMRIQAPLGIILLLTIAAAAESVTAADLDRVTVASTDRFTLNAYPSVVRLADDRLLCVISARDVEKTDGMIVVGAFSQDHGKTWSEPVTLIDSADEHDYDPNVTVIGPSVIVTSTTVPADHGERISTSRTIAVRSDDNGKTWSAPFEVPMGRRYTSGKINNGIVLRDGTALFGFSWEANLETVEFLTSEGQMEEVGAVMLSYDGGRTWSASDSVFLDARKLSDRPIAINGVCEPALVECRDGSVYMLSRTGLERLYECRSDDGGRTWSKPTPSPLTGHNAPAALCRFTGERDGVLVVWNNSPKHRWPLCVAASVDDCRTWTAPREIALIEGYQSSYPGCAQAADGTLVVVYQQQLQDGGREIIAARFAPEWLFTGEDSAAGEREAPNICTTPTPRINDESWKQQHELINQRVKSGPVDLIFVGDSITHRWEYAGAETWKNYYAHRNAANLGIDGDGTQTILWRLDHGNIEGISPKVAVVMIGTNNTTDPSLSAEQIAEGITAIVRKLRRELPRTKVLLLAIFPRGPSSTAEREKGAAASRLASRIADGRMIQYLDIGEAFMEPDGAISSDVMPDYIHLSPTGYAIWAEAMEPRLSQLLGDNGP